MLSSTHRAALKQPENLASTIWFVSSELDQPEKMVISMNMEGCDHHPAINKNEVTFFKEETTRGNREGTSPAFKKYHRIRRENAKVLDK